MSQAQPLGWSEASLAATLAVVALGGAFGSVVRALIGIGLRSLMGTGFPLGTLFVNLVGCGLIAWLAVRCQAPLLRAFLITGMLGGFTTFSAFALDTGTLWDRTPGLAALYVMVSVGGGLAAFALVRVTCG